MKKDKSHRQIVPLKSKLKKDPGVPRLPLLKTRQKASQSQDTTTRLLPPPHAHAPASPPDPPASARKHYLRALHKVIDESDIVLLVLDARDPEGCRSRLVEESVRRREAEGKKLVFVLNKIDLVPRDNAERWLRHLRHSTPTLPFRSASAAQQRSNPSSPTAPALLRLLKAYRPSKAQLITVGVVGYPNVGKSSLINALKRAHVCGVAAQPGHTRELQTVRLERTIRIVDSPGVVFDDDGAVGAGSSRGNVLLRNVVKVEDIDDPLSLVDEIVARTDAEVLQKIYKLPAYGTSLEFLTMHALSSGRLLKGGAPDVDAAARSVLKDWNQHKIPYFSVPPTVHPSSVPAAHPAQGAERVGQAQILTGLSKPFELEGLFVAADSGAFEKGVEGVVDGAVEGGAGGEMEGVVDDSVEGGALKRARSPSDAPPRQAKRLRGSGETYQTHPEMSVHNPMSRRMQRREAKKARRGHRGLRELREQMEGLELTFMI